MALQIDLDYNLTIISEPGFYQRFTTRKLTENLDPTAAVEGTKAFWADAETGTLMLYPLQLEKNWLNTANQFDYIVGLDELVVNPTDLTNQTIYQFNYQQNQYNPWIFHGPATPAASTPLVALSGQANLDQLADEAEAQLDVTGRAPSLFPGATSSMVVLCYTMNDLLGNQPLYLRWHVGKSAAGHATYYCWFIGQFAVVCGPTHVEIHEDISAAKDRTLFFKLGGYPIFGTGEGPAISKGGVTGVQQPSEDEAHDRALLWIPYRRNQVYLQSHTGRHLRFFTRNPPALNGLSGADQDFDIVKPAKLAVAALTPGPSWFQIQKIKWADGPVTFRVPTFTIDYTPATPLTSANLIDDADAFHGTALTHGTPTTPAGYTDRARHAFDDCPAPTTDTSAMGATYGVEYTLNNAADADGLKVWTPFLYGVDIRVPYVAASWAVSSTTVQDTTTGGSSPIASAKIVSSLEPGEGRFEALIHDRPPLALQTAYYQRSNFPVRLFEGATTYFTGIAEPNLVEPLRYDAGIMRELTVTARDLWKWLDDTTLRDQRDWTGVGHITVVKSVVQQCGISVAGADTPSESSSWNTPLGGQRSSIETITNELRPGWAPRSGGDGQPPDTAASYIKRIAKLFANFAVGFYPDGTFYYLPKNPWLYTTSEATFYKSRAANPAGPCYENPVEFENVEPEANIVQVSAHDATAGTLSRSSVYRDEQSIQNPAVVNFLGRTKTEREPLVLNAAFPCSELNRIAKNIYEAVRRRHLKGHFTADYVPSLKVGRLCTLEGQPGLYRVLSYRAEFIRTGIRKARYEVELDETGVGLA